MSKKPQVVDTPLDILQLRQSIVNSYNHHGSNVSAVSRELNLSRSTIYRHLRKMGAIKKRGRQILASGNITGTTHTKAKLPAPNEIKRYIITSAQNNTHIYGDVWKNLLALREYFQAELIVGTYSYDKNAYGPLSVKQGTYDSPEESLWFDPEIEEYIKDGRIELANGLFWCGEMNILPTAIDPLEGLETYSGRKSAIFPHAKMAMRSIPTMQGEGTKLNFTTGTVTKKNYLQKKAGLKAEHHHVYGALIVEVNHKGNWWVRQLEADNQGRIQDLTVLAADGKVTTGHSIEAITWGDIHATIIEPAVLDLSMEMLDDLQPRYQFIHDLMEGASVNHHNETDPFERHKTHLRGLDSISTEVTETLGVLNRYMRNNLQTVLVDSNHDNWFLRWLKSNDPRKGDPRNMTLYHEGCLAQLKANESGDENFNMTEWLLKRFDAPKGIRYLRTDESFTICNRKIECGMHGHLGPNGARGTPNNLNRVGRKAITAHTHSAGIYNGLYVAGTSSKLKMGYNHGPSSWSHSHVLTYPNGKRAIVTAYAGQWRA